MGELKQKKSTSIVGSRLQVDVLLAGKGTMTSVCPRILTGLLRRYFKNTQ
jgi:hypothetical protein